MADGYDTVRFWLDQAGRYALLRPAEELELGRSIRQWLDHPEGPDQAPARVIRRGRRARDRMVECNLRLVVTVCKHWFHNLSGQSQLDLLQASTIGLQRAAEKFDPTAGYKFSTYCYWWIRQAASRWYDEQAGGVLPVPVGFAPTLRQAGRKAREFQQAMGRPPTRAEVAEAVGVPVARLEQMAGSLQPRLSLDSPMGDDQNCSLVDLLAAPDDPAADEVAIVRSALEVMDGPSRLLLQRVWGIDRPQESAASIARDEGVSREAVRQRIARAQRRLRRVVEGCPVSAAMEPVYQAGRQLPLLTDPQAAAEIGDPSAAASGASLP